MSSVWWNYHRTQHNIPKECRSHHVFSFYVPSIKSKTLGIRHRISWNYIPWNIENIRFLLNKITTNSAENDTVHRLSKGIPCLLHITQFCGACVKVTTIIQIWPLCAYCHESHKCSKTLCLVHYTELHKIQTITVQSMARNSFTPISNIWITLWTHDHSINLCRNLLQQILFNSVKK
jgi:hypothetical protein